jgi:hypothetical protein
MQKRTWLFLLVGLAFSLALAAFVSPFASESPDGLDRFAEDQKIEAGESAWAHAPLAGYKAGSVPNERVSTGVAGVAGTLAAFAGMIGLGLLLRRKTAPVEGDA